MRGQPRAVLCLCCESRGSCAEKPAPKGERDRISETEMYRARCARTHDVFIQCARGGRREGVVRPAGMPPTFSLPGVHVWPPTVARPADFNYREQMRCVTATPIVKDGRLVLHPSMCTEIGRRGGPIRGVAQQRCLLVPTFASHYAHAHRLLESVKRHARDVVENATVVVVFSDAVTVAARQFCASYSDVCDGSFEATDLGRLIDAEVNEVHSRVRGVKTREARFARTAALLQELENRNHTHPRASAVEESFGLTNGFWISALKKILGASVTTCTQTWVVDSESVAFRPFTFRGILDEYWRDPAVFTGSSVSYIPGFASSQRFARQGLLLNRSLAFLGLAAEGQLEWPTYRFADYWHFDARLMREMMAHVARTAQPQAPSFVDAFCRSGEPVHELIYYLYAQFGAANSSFAATRSRRGVHRFVNGTAAILAQYKRHVPRPTNSLRANCTFKSTLVSYLDTLPDVRVACKLLRSFGHRAIRFHFHSRYHPCFSAQPGIRFLQASAQRCNRRGELTPASKVDRATGESGEEPLFSWLLNEDAAFTSLQALAAGRPNRSRALAHGPAGGGLQPEVPVVWFGHVLPPRPTWWWWWAGISA